MIAILLLVSLPCLLASMNWLLSQRPSPVRSGDDRVVSIASPSLSASADCQ